MPQKIYEILRANLYTFGVVLGSENMLHFPLFLLGVTPGIYTSDVGVMASVEDWK